jgi:hypothetical protein
MQLVSFGGRESREETSMLGGKTKVKIYVIRSLQRGL